MARISSAENRDVHLVNITCGTFAVRQATMSIKSAVTVANYNEHRTHGQDGLTQLGQLHIHVISNHMVDLCQLRQVIDGWPSTIRATFKISYHLVKRHLLQSLFRFRCAEQKLLIHTVLPPEVDSAIYFDSDFLFFSDPRLLWLQIFPQMSASQLLGAMKDYYGIPEKNPFDQYIPVYKGVEGLNAGVLVLNLTRIRERSESWLSAMVDIRYRYPFIVLADQSLLNIYLSSRPELVYDMDCSWGYRYDFCVYEDYCPHLEHSPVIHALHGVGYAFHTVTETPWSVSYRVWSKYEMGSDPQRYVIDELRRILPSPMPRCHTSVDLTQTFTV